MAKEVVAHSIVKWQCDCKALFLMKEVRRPESQDLPYSAGTTMFSSSRRIAKFVMIFTFTES
jgi:hypothetical protein